MYVASIIAKWILIVLVVAALFCGLNSDINGRPKKEPEGMSGAVATVLTTALILTLYWLSGALDGAFFWLED